MHTMIVCRGDSESPNFVVQYFSNAFIDEPKYYSRKPVCHYSVDNDIVDHLLLILMLMRRP
jgi:hypothetical protein